MRTSAGRSCFDQPSLSIVVSTDRISEYAQPEAAMQQQTMKGAYRATIPRSIE